MPLKTSASTPLLASLVGGDVEANTPLRRLHLRPFSSAFGSRKGRSETDLQILDKDKGLQSSAHQKKSAPLKSMCISGEPRQFSSMRGGAHGSETEVRDFRAGGGFNGQGGSAGGRNDEYFHSNNNNSKDRDGYYQKLLEANSGNPLLLRNYARFSHEVKHDVVQAEIYFDRAVQAAPDDCYVVASHAYFLWSTEDE